MKRHTLFATLLALLLPAGARAVDKDFTLTVTAGKTDRTSTLVCVPLSLPEKLAREQLALLRLPEGGALLGQLTAPGLLTESIKPAKDEVRRDLHLFLPPLKAGASLTLKGSILIDMKGPAERYSWHDTKGEFTELRYGDRPVLRYMDAPFDDSTPARREATFKVYHHLFDPEGKEVITKGPGGLYTHHRGLFYGFKATYGPDDKRVTADTWHCPPPSNDPKKPSLEAHQEHEKVLSSEAGPILGRHRVQVGWFGRDKERFAVEERELTVYAVSGGTLVEFASKLTPVKGAVHLDGDPQHAGFHFRANSDVEKTKDQTYFLRPFGKGEPGKEENYPQDKKMVDLPWNAMSFVAGDRRYTAAYLDRPTNPKEARYSERTYGRFGSYFVADCSDKKPLTVAYRLWLQAGEMSADAVKAKAEDFVNPPAVTVK
jgi:hypothetical protein